jgi:hypothetical protein
MKRAAILRRGGRDNLSRSPRQIGVFGVRNLSGKYAHLRQGVFPMEMACFRLK